MNINFLTQPTAVEENKNTVDTVFVNRFINEPFPAGGTALHTDFHSQIHGAHGCAESLHPDGAPSLKCGYENLSLIHI